TGRGYLSRLWRDSASDHTERKNVEHNNAECSNAARNHAGCGNAAQAVTEQTGAGNFRAGTFATRLGGTLLHRTLSPGAEGPVRLCLPATPGRAGSTFTGRAGAVPDQRHPDVVAPRL